MKKLYHVIVFNKDEFVEDWFGSRTAALKELNDYLSNCDINKDIHFTLQLAIQ